MAVEARAQELIARLVPVERQSLALETIDGRVDNSDEAMRALDRCREALETRGMLGGRKVVWFRRPDFLGGVSAVRSETVTERIAAFVQYLKGGLPREHTLVITLGAIDKRLSFCLACREVGSVCELSLTEKSHEADRDARGFADEQCRKLRLRLGTAAIEAFVSRAGIDRRQLASEAEKLALYVGKDREATLEDVYAVVSPCREALAWDLADAVGERDLPKALRILRQLLFQKEQPIGLLAGLDRRVQAWLIYRTAMDRGWVRFEGYGYGARLSWSLPAGVEESLAIFGKDNPRVQHPYRALLAARQAARYSMAELLRGRDLVVRARARLVESGPGAPLVMEMLLIQFMGRAGR